jgi:hypothetical protein
MPPGMLGGQAPAALRVQTASSPYVQYVPTF